MRARQSQHDRETALSGQERSALEEFLAFIEERVKGAEPVCADLVRMARLVLMDHGLPEQDPNRSLH